MAVRVDDPMGLSVADLALWRAVGWFSSGTLDGIPAAYIRSSFPMVWSLHVAVDQLPKVIAWKAQNPHHYAQR